jgi:hypothetical protein
MIYNLDHAQIINDMDEFIQRDGFITNKLLLRSKLRLLNNITEMGRTKTRIRGLLIRLNKLNPTELTLRVLDIIKSLSKRLGNIKSDRKIKLNRMLKATDTVEWIPEESYPLGIEY